MDSAFFNKAEFVHAINDYYLLLCRNYPKTAVLKIVGDRYKLTGEQRTMLFRGVFASDENKLRTSRYTFNIANSELHIDGYNVLFTLLNYRLGKLVFLSTDGFCRDAGSLFGKIRKQEQFSMALQLLTDFLREINTNCLFFYYDAPVSFSREHKYLTEKLCSENRLNAIVKLAKSADAEIKTQISGIICTSDSAIINASGLLVADLPYQVLNQFYTPRLPDLRNFIDTATDV